MLSILLPLATLAVEAFASGSSFSPLRPPAIPLAVKSPYLSTWQQAGSNGGDGGYLAGQWPTFWAGQVTGWCGLIRVDNTTYTWMGAPSNIPRTVNQVAFSYTATRSIFTLDVDGQVEMNVTFLSSVTPDDLKRSSLPFAYMDVEVSSIDGKQHDIQLYSDISAEWVSGDHSAAAQWEFGSVASDFSSNVSYHKVYRQQQLQFSETNDQANWGNWYYATAQQSGLTYQSGRDASVRGNFVNNGKLPDSKDTNYRPINQNYPVFGFAVDYGSVGAKAQSTLFQLSVHQNDCIQFEGGKDQVSQLPCMWTNYFDSDVSALLFFYSDFSTASTKAVSFDNQVESDSVAAGGSAYSSLTSLAARQAFASLEFTNTPDDPLVFMKEISSDGNVNTVDVIFPFHPIALYTNVSILKWLLDPLFINQEAGNWPNNYAVHDIGSSFPNATGHNNGNAEYMPLEECGNMLIMTLAYAQRANDNAYITKHYSILKQWTTYLVQEALIPADQISTDDFAGSAANQTNLAIKGIIGIQAMAQIANRTGNTADGQNYSRIAESYIQQWQGFAIDSQANPPHTTFNYGNESSYSLLYNLYADAELGLELVPQSIYTMQSTFYNNVFNEYGVPLDTRHTETKNDWELFCAAIASTAVKNRFISTIANWEDVTVTSRPLTDLYDTITGNYPSDGPTFVARPVVGGHFALLALESAPSGPYEAAS